MKKIVGLYKEFGGENERMRDSFCKEPYRGQDKVSKYLRNGGVLLNCAPSILRDVFTGEKISEPQSTRSDDSYIWMSELAYYVDNYNLRLPIEFENHILNDT